MTIMASGMDYAIEGFLKGMFKETWDDETENWYYEIIVGDEIYYIEIDQVSWISTKKMQYKTLKVVDISQIKK